MGIIPKSPVQVTSVTTLNADGTPGNTVSDGNALTVVVQFNRPTLPKTVLGVANNPNISTSGQAVLIYERSTQLPVGVTSFRLHVPKNAAQPIANPINFKQTAASYVFNTQPSVASGPLILR